MGASPAPSLTHLFPLSPHPGGPTLPAQTSAVKQKQGPTQQQEPISTELTAAAVEAAVDAQQTHPQSEAQAPITAAAHETEAQWEADSLGAAQAASRLSLLQAEQTEAGLELASLMQAAGESQTKAQIPDKDSHHGHASHQMSFGSPTEASLVPHAGRLSHPAAQEAAVVAGDNGIAKQHQTATMAEQNDIPSFCQIVKHDLPSQGHSLSQSGKPRTRRQTRSSARASLAAQSATSEVMSTASARRGKTHAKAMPALPAVKEQSEADLAVTTAETHRVTQQLPVATDSSAVQAAPAAAADPAADLASSRGEQHEAEAEEDQQAESTGIGPRDSGQEASMLPAEAVSSISGTGPELDESHSLHNGRLDGQTAAGAMLASQPTAPEDVCTGCGHATASLANPSCTTAAPAEAAGEGATVSAQAEGAGEGATSSAPAEAAVEATTVEEDSASEQQALIQLHGRPGSGERDVHQDADHKQGTKRGGRAKRPPKPKQPAKKKQGGKRRKLTQQDENADGNTAANLCSEPQVADVDVVLDDQAAPLPDSSAQQEVDRTEPADGTDKQQEDNNSNKQRWVANVCVCN